LKGGRMNEQDKPTLPQKIFWSGVGLALGFTVCAIIPFTPLIASFLPIPKK